MSNHATVKTFQCSYRFSGNVYVVSSDKGNVIVDLGYYDNEMEDYIKKIGGVDAVLLTHGHWDHTAGLDDFKKDFPNVPVYLAEKDHSCLKNSTLNGSIINGFEVILNSKVENTHEGDMKIGNYDVEVTYTPGHSVGSSMYYFKNEDLLFTGDTMLKNFVGPTDRPTGSSSDMKNTLVKFKSLGYNADTPTYPGHGESTTYGYLVNHYCK